VLGSLTIWIAPEETKMSRACEASSRARRRWMR
jgi:hypothetical protein